MLHYPSDTDDRWLRVAAIDPGGDTLGIAIHHIDLVASVDYIVDIVTLKAARAVSRTTRYDHWIDRFGDRNARRHWSAEQLESIFNFHWPHAVVAESPFVFKSPTAFRSLVETLTTIRDVALNMNPSIHFDTVAPKEAKKIWDVAGPGTSKDDVRKAFLTRLQDPETHRLQYRATLPPTALDEHSVDAILVGYHFFHRWCLT